MNEIMKLLRMSTRMPLYAPEGVAGGGSTGGEEGGEGDGDGGDTSTVLGGGVPAGQQAADGADDGDGEPEGDQGEGDPDPLDLVPEDGAYTFEIDEDAGFELSEQAQSAYSAAFKEAGMTQRQVNATVAAHQHLLSTMAEQAEATATQQLKDWVAEAKSDPEMGKDWDSTVKLATEALVKIADDQVIEQLNRTGLGNHPAMIRMFHRLGKMMGEDNFTNGSPTESAAPAERSWYGKTTPETKRA